MLQNRGLNRANVLLCRNLKDVPHHRLIYTSITLSKFRDKFVSAKDLNKRPSDMEIEKKGLPKNTPTLGERIRRDQSSDFYSADRKGGYYRGTGDFREYIPKDYSLHDAVSDGVKTMKEEIIKWKNEKVEAPWIRLAIPGTDFPNCEYDGPKCYLTKRNLCFLTSDFRHHLLYNTERI